MIEPIIGKQPPEMFFCRQCHIEISKEKEESAIKARWIPLCEKCEPEIKEKFKKFYELWPKLNRSLGKNSPKK